MRGAGACSFYFERDRTRTQHRFQLGDHTSELFVHLSLVGVTRFDSVAAAAAHFGQLRGRSLDGGLMTSRIKLTRLACVYSCVASLCLSLFALRSDGRCVQRRFLGLLLSAARNGLSTCVCCRSSGGKESQSCKWSLIRRNDIFLIRGAARSSCRRLPSCARMRCLFSY